MYEMAISIPLNEQWENAMFILINKLIPVITILQEKCGAEWYCYLIHNNQNGLSIPNNNGLQFHLRFENSNNLSIDQVKSFLPEYCLMLQKIDKPLTEISGINNSLLKGNDIALAWKVIGESCEWIIKMLLIHNTEGINEISKLPDQILQFQHFITNITQIKFI